MTGTSATSTDDVTADVVCSFCLKPTSDIATMVAGPGVFICDECVGLCVELIETKPAVMPKLPSWKERVSDQDLLETLPKIAAAGTQVDRQLAEWVTHARARGITWTRIGAALGMTRQSAWERFSGGVAAVSVTSRPPGTCCPPRRNAVDRTRRASAKSAS